MRGADGRSEREDNDAIHGPSLCCVNTNYITSERSALIKILRNPLKPIQIMHLYDGIMQINNGQHIFGGALLAYFRDIQGTYMKTDHLYQHSNSHDMETTVSKYDIHEDRHTELLMQFGNLGRICSSRPFERQHQELPDKNNSFLPPVIANICNCTKQPIHWITVPLKRNA